MRLFDEIFDKIHGSYENARAIPPAANSLKFCRDRQKEIETKWDEICRRLRFSANFEEIVPSDAKKNA